VEKTCPYLDTTVGVPYGAGVYLPTCFNWVTNKQATVCCCLLYSTRYNRQQTQLGFNAKGKKSNTQATNW